MEMVLEIVAEQRAAVAHSASYGRRCRDDFQAPAGAQEGRFNLFGGCAPIAGAMGYYRAPLRG